MITIDVSRSPGLRMVKFRRSTPISLYATRRTPLDQVHRSEWIEWLDTLRFTGTVDVEPTTVLPRAVGECTLRAADYAPFDRVVEIVLEDLAGQIRVIIDDPMVIWVEGVGSSTEAVGFDTPKGRIVVRGHDHTPAQPAARAMTSRGR
jgi:hypothetical protein